MKRIAFVIVIVLALVLLVGCDYSQSNNNDFLRIHIRANSNDNVDQEVKYKVKSAVVEYLVPYIAKASSKTNAVSIISSNLNGIMLVADRVLADNGYEYTSKAKVISEQFPTRLYDQLVLEAGIYDALVIELGTGVGDNWWCVVYPPLCFVGGESNGTNTFKYKSLLMEMIDKFFNTEE